MKQGHVIIISVVVLVGIVGVVAYGAGKTKRQIINPTVPPPQPKSALDTFIQEHGKDGDPYMMAAYNVAGVYLKTKNITHTPFNSSVEMLHFAVQNGLNPSEIINVQPDNGIR